MGQVQLHKHRDPNPYLKIAIIERKIVMFVNNRCSQQCLFHDDILLNRNQQRGPNSICIENPPADGSTCFLFQIFDQRPEIIVFTLEPASYQ